MMPIEKLLQLLEILAQGFEHRPLMQGGGWVKQRKEHEVLQIKGLSPHPRDPDFPLQKGLRGPIPQRTDQCRFDRGDLLQECVILRHAREESCYAEE